MAHGLFCKCKGCNPSLLDSIFAPTKKGPFYNSGSSGSKVSKSPRYGAGQVYYGGKGKADGVGHGHYNPNNGFNRSATSDFLGNKAIRSSGVNLGDKRRTPKW